MATKKVYDECCRVLREHPIYRISSKVGGSRRIYRPDMVFLFGKKKLVTERELMCCGESEKRRHLREDFILLSTYIELDSYVKFASKGSNVVTEAKNAEGGGEGLTGIDQGQ